MSITVSEPRTRIHIFYDAVSKSYVARIHRASGDVEWHDGFRSVQEAAVAADKLCREERGHELA